MADLPRAEAIRQAGEHIRQGWDVHFKFTCSACHNRCTLQDANTIYEKGECFRCGHLTELNDLGYMLVRQTGEITDAP